MNNTTTWTIIWELMKCPLHVKWPLHDVLFDIILDHEIWETGPESCHAQGTSLINVLFDSLELNKDTMIEHLVEKCKITKGYVDSQFHPYVERHMYAANQRKVSDKNKVPSTSMNPVASTSRGKITKDH